VTPLLLRIDRHRQCTLDGTFEQIVDDPNQRICSIGTIRIHIDKNKGEVSMDIPFASTDALYWSLRREELRISNDPRCLGQENTAVDDRSLFSIL